MCVLRAMMVTLAKLRHPQRTRVRRRSIASKGFSYSPATRGLDIFPVSGERALAVTISPRGDV